MDPSTATIVKSGLVQKKRVHYKVVSSRPFGEQVELREFENIDCDGAPILEGFPAVSLTPIIVANYLAEQLQLPFIGDIICNEFPARSIVTNGEPASSVRILGNKKLVVFLSEFAFAKPEVTHFIIHAMLDFATRHKSSSILTVEGISRQSVERELFERAKLLKAAEANSKADSKAATSPSVDKNGKTLAVAAPKERARKPSGDDLDLTPEEKVMKDQATEKAGTTILFLTNSQTIDSQMLAMGHVPFANGVIDGITGKLVSEMAFTSVNIHAFVVSADMRFPDAHSAVNVVRCLATLLPELKVDLKPLEDKAKMLEKSINRLTATMNQQKQSPAVPSMYI